MSIKAEYLVKISTACSEIIGRIRLFLLFFSLKYKNKQTIPRNYCTEHHHICTRYSHIYSASKLPIDVPMEWRRDKENLFANNSDFATLIGCHDNVPNECNLFTE